MNETLSPRTTQERLAKNKGLFELAERANYYLPSTSIYDFAKIYEDPHKRWNAVRYGTVPSVVSLDTGFEAYWAGFQEGGQPFSGERLLSEIVNEGKRMKKGLAALHRGDPGFVWKVNKYLEEGKIPNNLNILRELADMFGGELGRLRALRFNRTDGELTANEAARSETDAIAKTLPSYKYLREEQAIIFKANKGLVITPSLNTTDESHYTFARKVGIIGHPLNRAALRVIPYWIR